MAYIPQATLEVLAALRRQQDEAAQRLGVLTLDWVEAVESLRQRIAQTRLAQQRVGEQALQQAEFEPATEDLTIDLGTGEIKRLVAGRWEGTGP